jgi:hypothetical protein
VSLSSRLIINEVFPNPESGSEWIEIYCLEENPINAKDYVGFTISDEKRIIYSFDGNEVWLNNFTIIEVAGLNNDQDSVILKNSEGLVVDQMSYDHSEKNLSWLRINTNESTFILGEASPLFTNKIPILTTPIPTPILSYTPSPPVVNHSIETIPNIINTPSPTTNPQNINLGDTDCESTKTEIINKDNTKPLSEQELAGTYFANYQNGYNLQISYSQEKQFPQTRLVFLGQKILKAAIIDAIIGSSLLVVAAILLSYENQTNRKKEKNSSLF